MPLSGPVRELAKPFSLLASAHLNHLVQGDCHEEGTCHNSGQWQQACNGWEVDSLHFRRL